VAIARGPSSLAVTDTDHGLKDAEGAREFLRKHLGVSATYAVRTGRRDDYGVQYYFTGPIDDVGLWKLGGCEGQIMSLGVMAAGSVHPVSKERYGVLWGGPPVSTPLSVRGLKSESKQVSMEPGKKIPEGAGRLMR